MEPYDRVGYRGATAFGTVQSAVRFDHRTKSSQSFPPDLSCMFQAAGVGWQMQRQLLRWKRQDINRITVTGFLVDPERSTHTYANGGVGAI